MMQIYFDNSNLRNLMANGNTACATRPSKLLQANYLAFRAKMKLLFFSNSQVMLTDKN